MAFCAADKPFYGAKVGASALQGSILLLNIADDALIDVENLRVAGGEQQENAPLDQRNDLLRRFAARRPDLVRRHRAQAVGQTVAHLLQIGIAAEIGFGFLRLCGQEVQLSLIHI